MECAFNEEDESRQQEQPEVSSGIYLHSVLHRCKVLYTSPLVSSIHPPPSHPPLLCLFWELCGRQITVSALHFALPRVRLLIDTC